MFDAPGLTGAPSRQDAVVNLASAMPSTLQFVRVGAWRDTQRIRTEGSANVVDAAMPADVGVLVQESVAMLYTDHGDAWVDEQAAVDRYPMASGNHAAEASANRFSTAGRTGIILRFGFFYGPGARHSEQFLAMARLGVVPVLGHPDRFLSSIHLRSPIEAASRGATYRRCSGILAFPTDIARKAPWGVRAGCAAGQRYTMTSTCHTA